NGTALGLFLGAGSLFATLVERRRDLAGGAIVHLDVDHTTGVIDVFARPRACILHPRARLDDHVEGREIVAVHLAHFVTAFGEPIHESAAEVVVVWTFHHHAYAQSRD